jgi:ferredoxin-NADP reductase
MICPLMQADKFDFYKRSEKRLEAITEQTQKGEDDMKHGPAMHTKLMSKQRVAHEVALKGKKQIAEGTYEFVFEKPSGFRFSAGQHVRMTLIDPPETDAEGNRRFFTISSAPQEPDLGFAMRMRDTAFKRVLSSMQTGQKVLIEMLLESPQGSLVLQEDASKPVVFIAGGIGIVPAYSMIKDAIQKGLAHKMFLFYSNRRPEDATYLKELQDLAGQNPSLILVATMTQSEKSAQTWPGETGFINRALLEKYVDDLRSPIYYVAGLPEMVNGMQAMLADMGINRDNIRAEEFDGFKMGHNEEPSRSKGKSHLLLAAVGLMALAMVSLHVAGVSHADLTRLSWKNPLTFLIMAFLLSALSFKGFALLKFKRTIRSGQGRKKSLAQNILEAHQPTHKK